MPPLLGLAIILSSLPLPVYALATEIKFFVFGGRNGYLFAHEYFEVVALRRLDRTATRAARYCADRPILPGGRVMTGVFALQPLDRVTARITAAFTVHIFDGLRRAEPYPWAA